MDYLLDTHALLWFTGGDKRLSDNARKIIEDVDNRLMVSAASLFEISIKVKIGKMDLKKSLDVVYRDIQTASIDVIPIEPSHLLTYQNIPFYADHRDPFDRVIIATAMVENSTIITVDPKFQYYSDLVRIVW